MFLVVSERLQSAQMTMRYNQRILIYCNAEHFSHYYEIYASVSLAFVLCAHTIVYYSVITFEQLVTFSLFFVRSRRFHVINSIR